MLNKLLLSGGRLRPNGFELGEGKYYDLARLVELDLSSGECRVVVEKSEGGDNYPEEHPNLQFTVGSVDGDVIWLPTDTEVHCYRLADFQLLKVYSHPCFHNIHSAQLFDECLYITSTGLDNVVVLNKHTGDIVKILNCEAKDPWHRFDQNVDYRKIHSTRPHDCHPNYVFKVNGEFWVTRCTQEDAVKLSDPSDRIDIDLGGDKGVHDGVWWNKQLVFTQVDGNLLLCDPNTQNLTEIFDPFKQITNRPMGWCRGLLVDGNDFYLGFSKLRKTNVRSRLKFLSQGNFKYASGNNALVVKIDMASREVKQTFDTPDGMIDAIYGIMPGNYD